MDPNKQITETLKELLAEMNAMKTTLPSSELRIIQLSMEEFKHAQSDMKKDLSDLKKKLLDPDDGVIVKVNENTRFRIQEENRYNDYMKMNVDVQDLKKWQSGINKAMWIVFGALIAIAVKVIFNES